MHNINIQKLVAEYEERLSSAPPIASCPETITQYMEDVDRVRADAIADGVQGRPFLHYFMKKGLFTGKVEVRHKPLNNADMYVYAKRKFSSRSGETK